MSEPPASDGSDTPDPHVVEYTPAHDSPAAVVDDVEAGGTYVLVFRLDRDATIEVGALGRVPVPAGDYAYVGSAFGPGGFGRAERHRSHLAGESDTVHWHIDALTTRPETSFVAAFLCPEIDVECDVASHLPPGPVDGFGSSDCGCRTHLSAVARDGVSRIVARVVEAAGSA